MSTGASFDDLRVAVARAVNELTIEHSPIWSTADAREAGNDPIGCTMCWPRDGHWPCMTRMVADDLQIALRGAR
jgi:hypothetical protein